MRELHQEVASVYYVEVGQPDKLKALGVVGLQPLNDGFTLDLEKTDVPAFIRKLVAADIDLFIIQPYTQRLEDQFIEMTGGGAIDAIN